MREPNLIWVEKSVLRIGMVLTNPSVGVRASAAVRCGPCGSCGDKEAAGGPHLSSTLKQDPALAKRTFDNKTQVKSKIRTLDTKNSIILRFWDKIYSKESIRTSSDINILIS